MSIQADINAGVHPGIYFEPLLYFMKVSLQTRNCRQHIMAIFGLRSVNVWKTDIKQNGDDKLSYPLAV